MRSPSYALFGATLVLVACSATNEKGSSSAAGSGASGGTAGATGTVGAGGFHASGGTGGISCTEPSKLLKPADPADAQLAPEFVDTYFAYDLGTPPGMPSGHLGGCVILHNDMNKLLLVGASELESAGLYVIGVVRDACGHIDGWKGTAEKVASVPFMDASLVYAKNDTLLYSMWPVAKIGQLLPGASSPASETDLGVTDSPGGLGFVPSFLPAAAGQLRALGHPYGSFYNVAAKLNGDLFDITGVTVITSLMGGPGGFAYVPPGSPLFPKPSIIIAEWSDKKVAAYEVNATGDPKLETRSDFFSFFASPWGAYFEPVTGDYIFVGWHSSPDKLFIVRGFEKPPAAPTPN
ncbi:MAG: hypothetical protein EXR75_14405 [Myxococcales bacterium]|nr:hypothetical protein [Myxococcales bacterium]